MNYFVKSHSFCFKKKFPCFMLLWICRLNLHCNPKNLLSFDQFHYCDLSLQPHCKELFSKIYVLEIFMIVKFCYLIFQLFFQTSLFISTFLYFPLNLCLYYPHSPYWILVHIYLIYHFFECFSPCLFWTFHFKLY